MGGGGGWSQEGGVKQEIVGGRDGGKERCGNGERDGGGREIW